MLTVAIASGDMASSAQLLASLEQTGLVRSVKQWSVPADKLPESGDAMPDIVFLDLARDPEPYFQLGAQIHRARPAVKLVACSSVVPPNHQLLLEAMRSGVQDFLPKPVDPRSLKEILSRFSKDIDGNNERSSLDRLIVVMGSKGGVGTTTVAVNVGVQLATHARKHTALLDFANPLGNVHLLLDLHPKFTVRDTVDSLDRLDSHFFAGLMTRHKTKLEVLGGATQPEEWQSIPIPMLDRVINVAQNNFEMVLVDMGTQFSSEWSSILRMARMILIVAEANVPALWTLERRLLALKGFGIDLDRARLIINRWHKGDEEVLKGIQKDINRPVFACLPNDFRMANNAINLGTPMHENGNNALGSRYRQIAGQLAGLDVAHPPKKGSLGGFFSFPAKR
jgi:pilus assembly protein CpaE